MMQQALDTANELRKQLPDDPDIILAIVRVMECMRSFDLNRKGSEMLERAIQCHQGNKQLELAYVTLHMKWVRFAPERIDFTEKIVRDFARKHPHDAEFTEKISQIEKFRASGEVELAQKIQHLSLQIYSKGEVPSVRLLKETEELLEICKKQSVYYLTLVELKANALFNLRRLDECLQLVDGATGLEPKLAFLKAKALQERGASPEDSESAVRIFDELFQGLDAGSFPKQKVHTGLALIHACMNWAAGESMVIRQRTTEALNDLFPDDHDLSLQLVIAYEELGDMASLIKAQKIAALNNKSEEFRRHQSALDNALRHGETASKTLVQNGRQTQGGTGQEKGL